MVEHTIKIEEKEVKTAKDSYILTAGMHLFDGKPSPALVFSIEGKQLKHSLKGEEPKRIAIMGTKPRNIDYFIVDIEGANCRGIVDYTLHSTWITPLKMESPSLGRNGLQINHFYARDFIKKQDKKLLEKLHVPVFEPENFAHPSLFLILKYITREKITEEEMIGYNSFLCRIMGIKDRKVKKDMMRFEIDELTISQYPKKERDTQEKLEKILGRKLGKDLEHHLWFANLDLRI